MRSLGIFLSLAVHCGAIGGVVVVGMGIGKPLVAPRPLSHIEVEASDASSGSPATKPQLDLPHVVVEQVAEAMLLSEFDEGPPPASEPTPSDPVAADAAATPSPIWLQRCLAPKGMAAAAMEPAESRSEAPAPTSAYVEASQFSDNLPPEYPQHDRTSGHEGTVVLLVQIDARGCVSDAQLSEPCAFPGLNRAAVRAVRSWRFEPALQDGVAVPSAMRIPIVFQLVATGSGGKQVALAR